MNICAMGENDSTVREKARLLRRIVGCGKIKRFPVLEFLERVLCAPDSDVKLEIVAKDDMPDAYATTNTALGIIKIREDVYEGAYNENPRDRFTICHEIGHFFLHQPESISFAHGRVFKQHSLEFQANVFAAELLAPLPMIRGYNVAEVHEYFGISKQSASYQLQKVM